MPQSCLWYHPHFGTFLFQTNRNHVKPTFQMSSLPFFNVYIIWLRNSFLLVHIQIIFNNVLSEKHVITVINLNRWKHTAQLNCHSRRKKNQQLYLPGFLGLRWLFKYYKVHNKLSPYGIKYVHVKDIGLKCDDFKFLQTNI